MYNPYQLDHSKPTHKDYIDTTDFDQSEMLDMIKLSTPVRDYIKSGKTLSTLYHKNLAMIFEQKSTRTRVSFEVAMEQLGGHALNLAPGSIQLGAHETIGDTAQVLARMCDLIMARVNHHESVLELAARSSVPVINGMSDWNHPTQELGDIITIFDHLPEGICALPHLPISAFIYYIAKLDVPKLIYFVKKLRDCRGLLHRDYRYQAAFFLRQCQPENNKPGLSAYAGPPPERTAKSEEAVYTSAGYEARPTSL